MWTFTLPLLILKVSLMLNRDAVAMVTHLKYHIKRGREKFLFLKTRWFQWRVKSAPVIIPYKKNDSFYLWEAKLQRQKWMNAVWSLKGEFSFTLIQKIYLLRCRKIMVKAVSDCINFFNHDLTGTPFNLLTIIIIIIRK